MSTEDTTNEVSTEVTNQGVDTSTSQVDDKTKSPQTQIENKDAEQNHQETKDDKDDSVDFEKTGNTVLDYAIDAIAGMGFKPGDHAVKLAYQGDFDLLKAEMAQKGTKGWEQIAALLEKGYKEEVDKQNEFTKSIDQAIDQVFDGDKEYRDKVFKFAKEAAAPEEINLINSLLDESPFAAKVAISYLKNVYELSTNKTQQPAQAVKKTAAVQTPNSGALSPDQFFEEVEKLSERIGRNKVDTSPEYKQLVQRRQAWR